MVHFPKTQPAPPCLAIEEAKNGDYNCEGVLNQLKSDFKNKCYICEFKAPPVINTEHFLPHKNANKALKYDWNNLFYCCGHCNNIKLAKKQFDDILNCTETLCGVDTKISYRIKPFPKEMALLEVIENTPTVNNTVELLKLCYNGHTILKTIESANIRAMLLKEVLVFQNMLLDFYDDLHAPDQVLEIKAKIINQLGVASPFAAFKRWIIRDNLELMKDFGAFL
jgi:hypothetical protein